MKKYKLNYIATIILCIWMGGYYVIRELSIIPIELKIVANVSIFIINLFIILGSWIPLRKVDEFASYIPKGTKKEIKLEHYKKVIETLSFHLTRKQKIFVVISMIVLMLALNIAQMYGYYNNHIVEIILNVESCLALLAVFLQMHSTFTIVESMTNNSPH